MPGKERGRKGVKALLVLVCFTASVLSACTSNENGMNKGGKEQNPDKPLEVSIMTTFRGAEPPLKDNPIWIELENKLNVKLNITWYSPNNYLDKMNVTLASGDLPDLLLIENPFAPNVVSAVKQGVFWDLTDIVTHYPNLMAAPKDSWENIKIENKIYGITRARPTVGQYGIPIVRKDWLDKLNLEVPETMDDLYQVMKAFTEQDPDGNGLRDTPGFVGMVEADNMGYFTWARDVFNHANGWKVDGDQIIHPDLLPGTREALLWWNKAYTEGLVNPDFAVMKLSRMKDQLKAGKGGVFSSAVIQDWILLRDLRKVEPKADYYPLNYVQGPGGRFVGRDTGHFGMYAISKRVPESKMKQILSMMDKGAADEIANIANFGMEGIHYNVVNGMKVSTEQAVKDNVSLEVFGQVFTTNDKYALRAFATGIPKDLYERNKLTLDEREKYSVANPAANLISETGDKYMPEVNKKSQDLKTKIIMGTEPIEAWDQFVQKLKADANFQKYIQEMNEAYKKSRGK